MAKFRQTSWFWCEYANVCLEDTIRILLHWLTDESLRFVSSRDAIGLSVLDDQAGLGGAKDFRPFDASSPRNSAPDDN